MIINFEAWVHSMSSLEALLLPRHFTRLFILSQPPELGVPQVPIRRPFRKLDLRD
jgi:hypothetical protein